MRLFKKCMMKISAAGIGLAAVTGKEAIMR